MENKWLSDYYFLDLGYVVWGMSEEWGGSIFYIVLIFNL